MATNKKGFILYADLINTVSKLPDEQAGKLFKLILEYVNDKDPTVDDLLMEIAFEPIKQQLKRDLQDWEAKKAQRSEAGKASAAARKLKKLNDDEQNQRPLKTVERDSTKSTVIVNDNVKVNVILKDDFYNSFTFLEAQAKAKKTTVDCINRLKVVFWEGNYEGQEQPKSLNDLKKHFGNWLKFQELDRIKPTIVKHWNEL